METVTNRLEGQQQRTWTTLYCVFEGQIDQNQ